MPAGPTSRGCKACRAQKKGCDQLKPACTRCKRLNIECVGAGEQRFRFVVSAEQPPNTAQLVKRTRVAILPSLTSNTISIGSQFIDAFGIGTSRLATLTTASHLCTLVPQRLGSNQALDAAVEAVTSGQYFMQNRGSQADVWRKYGRALQALGTCLRDSEQRFSANTACAIWFLIMCQNWISKTDMRLGNHLGGLCHVLNGFAESYDWSQTPNLDTYKFEVQIVAVTMLPLLLERFYNPKIKFGPWFQKLLAWQNPRPQAAGQPYTLSLRGIYQLTEFMQDPASHQSGITVAYYVLCQDIAQLRRSLAALNASITQEKSMGKNPEDKLGVKLAWSLQYGLLLPFAIILNYLLRAFPNVDSLPGILEEEAEHYMDESLRLAEDASCFRPMSTEWVPLMLCFAWATTTDAAKSAKTEELIRVYDEDFPGVNGIYIARWTKKWLETKGNATRGLRIEEARESERDTQLEALVGKGKSCCIL